MIEFFLVPDAWFLQSIRVRDINVEHGMIFHCSRWLFNSTATVTPLLPVPESAFLERNTYCIITTTSDEQYAGTDENIYLILRGREISSKPVLLNNSKSCFERGGKDEFIIEDVQIGHLASITIGYFPSSEPLETGDGWHLKSVIVSDTKTSMSYYFRDVLKIGHIITRVVQAWKKNRIFRPNYVIFGRF